MSLFSVASHAGRRRGHNEDCYLARPELGLWLVADGVGGHSSGEVASAIVRETLSQGFARGASLIDAIHESHQAILEEIANCEDSNMGSTVVALQLRGDEYEVAWVGDSRAYLFDGTQITQITRDHNPVSEMLARGAISAEQAANHPERNVLSQSLGVAKTMTVTPERICGQVKAGEQFLLCSDGLTDELSAEEIQHIMAAGQDPQTQVEALLQAALDAGGRDNITVMVVGDKTQAELPAANRPHNTYPCDKLVKLSIAAMVILALAWVVW